MTVSRCCRRNVGSEVCRTLALAFGALICVCKQLQRGMKPFLCDFILWVVGSRVFEEHRGKPLFSLGPLECYFGNAKPQTLLEICFRLKSD